MHANFCGVDILQKDYDLFQKDYDLCLDDETKANQYLLLRSLKMMVSNYQPCIYLDNYPSVQIAITAAGIKELDSSKSPGSDKISRKPLKLLATELSPCLLLIFTASFCQGIVTQDWKRALVTPLFIKGNRMEALKYCPILLNCMLRDVRAYHSH